MLTTMKIATTFTFFLFTSICCFRDPIADSKSAKLPSDALAAKKNYQQDIQRVIQPFRDRYIANLKVLLDRATRAGKLEDALAIKNELDAVSKSTAVSTETPEEFENKLVGTTWSWGTSSRLMKWKAVQPYTVDYRFSPNNHHGTIVFDRELGSASIREIQGGGKVVDMVLTRVKE